MISDGKFISQTHNTLKQKHPCMIGKEVKSKPGRGFRGTDTAATSYKRCRISSQVMSRESSRRLGENMLKWLERFWFNKTVPVKCLSIPA